MQERAYNESAVSSQQSAVSSQHLVVSHGGRVRKFIRYCLEWRKYKHRFICCVRYAVDLTRKKTKFCIICGHKVGKFYPGGISEEIFTRHHIIGGGPRDNCTCPYCRSIDRARWQYYVLQHFTEITSAKGIRVLHFAPERPNSKLIRSNPNCTYITADIVTGAADYAADMTNLFQFEDSSFDYVIANHVLEHIPDEAKAFSELKRILKENGKLVISFPVCMDMPTYEDPAITTEEGRLKAFGQTDHVRLYGSDFREHVESYGLDVKVYQPEAVLSPEAVEKYALIKDDIMMVCSVKA